jgi:RP/EB family microtubule-associated protein
MKKVGSVASSSSSAPRAVASGAVKRAAPPVARSVASSVSSNKDAPPRPTSGGSSVSSITRISAASGSLKENASNARGVPTTTTTRKPPSSSNAVAVTQYEEEIRALKSENAALESKYAELQRSSAVVEMSLQTVESERDFYFEKLRGIEVMLQVYKEKEEECTGSGDVNRVMERMFKVMYATMEDDVVVDDEGNVSLFVALLFQIDEFVPRFSFVPLIL